MLLHHMLPFMPYLLLATRNSLLALPLVVCLAGYPEYTKGSPMREVPHEAAAAGLPPVGWHGAPYGGIEGAGGGLIAVHRAKPLVFLASHVLP